MCAQSVCFLSVVAFWRSKKRRFARLHTFTLSLSLTTTLPLLTDGNGVIVPIINEMKLVIEVIVIDTAASEYVRPRRSGTESRGFVRRQAASSTKASSMPTPVCWREIIKLG